MSNSNAETASNTPTNKNDYFDEQKAIKELEFNINDMIERLDDDSDCLSVSLAEDDNVNCISSSSSKSESVNHKKGKMESFLCLPEVEPFTRANGISKHLKTEIHNKIAVFKAAQLIKFKNIIMFKDIYNRSPLYARNPERSCHSLNYVNPQEEIPNIWEGLPKSKFFNEECFTFNNKKTIQKLSGKNYK